MGAKSIMRGLLLLIAAIIINGHANAQTNEQRITVTVLPAQTVEERVADSIKERELRQAAEDKLAAEKSAKIAERNNPKTLLSHARTVFISSNTSYFEPVQLQNALRKHEEFESWQMALVDGWDKQNIADILIEVDRPVFTFTFTYKITDRSTGIILSTGKVNAFDGNAAAPELAKKIIEEMKVARGELKKKK